MRLRDLLTLRKPADVAADAQAAEGRTLAPLDALVIESREVLAHCRETLPHAFDDRRNRRAGDRAETRLPPFELDHKGGPNRGGAI